ncbi:DNA starvation/stationary phase protection protein Dps [Rhodoplanes elegans]|uniref:DNA starvation/stationary phase protection protein Dps n=1 Tax=Rhodoplanes elegans TaxID=29408 RepID=A0A327KXS2_9BRAD|nr:DNA starvation/stationary phase protection protein Dps [Rhodoplanes elegans]MBK5960318.1 DNA starvation/stationary phase protection protein Dps [Rhodoplanes elegans]RAI42355.1 DNA starvation/stationary phase protection protein Dps [Rhodoplanes elegans]
MTRRRKPEADISKAEDDPVIEADIESFPASDPPAWIPARIGPAVPIRPEELSSARNEEKTMHDTRIDLPSNVRGTVIGLLQARLADAADLASQAKQAHWNVKGPSFIALHELFDQVATTVREHTDMIAERITTLGGTAEGTVRAAAKQSTLKEYPIDIIEGRAHVATLADALASFGAKVRSNIEEAAEAGDQGTADLFTEISRSIDKTLWFVEAHGQAKS